MAKLKWILPCGLLALFLSFSWSTSWAIERSECLECHSDPFEREQSSGIKADLGVDGEKFAQSVHGKNDLLCTECHADIEELNLDNDVPHSTDLKTPNCPECHDSQQSALENGVHATVGEDGGPLACYTCHGYHYITKLEIASVQGRGAAFCKRCHEPLKLHPWLPQNGIHFSVIECSVCHVPTVENYVNLRFWGPENEKSLNGDEFVAALGTDYDGLMSVVDKSGDDIISGSEFRHMVNRLDDQDVEGTFHLEILAVLEPGIHEVTKERAIRECSHCHAAGTPILEKVKLSLHSADGTKHEYILEHDVLKTFALNNYYVIAGARLGIVDILGVLMVLGGLGVVGLHTFIRILTIPERQKRAEEGHH